MKRIIKATLAILCVSVSVSIAQQNVSGIIVDKQTKEPIPGVNIVIKGEAKGTITDLMGAFQLQVPIDQEISISYLGYETLQMKATADFDQVELAQSSVELNQVVISASRDAQMRSETPVAISSLSAQQIEEAKATSTDQLLNKTPGVYMVDLGNEQHSMAIRQPLSYKSLFLYLEDGVPVRTTGVFNHNALIEMNMASFKNIEVIRGPASSLYGSEAIGGAVNFITLNPTSTLLAKASVQANNLGYKRGDLMFSDTYGKVGVVASTNYATRVDGYRDHSDYEKFALTLKATVELSEKALWSNSMTYVNYRSDAAGSLDSASFYGQEYSSFQTFTDRDVEALRYKSALDYYWDRGSKSSATFFYRSNSVKQNPSYRIKDDYSPWANPGGDENLAHSEVNDNSFNSYGLILQHKEVLNFWNSSMTTGASLDYSPSSYLANYISVHKTDAGVYDGFTPSDSVLTNYETDLINYAGYAQLELNPVAKLHVTAAVRFDRFTYVYDNHLPSNAYSGAPDETNHFNAFTPKVGLNYSISQRSGMYANFSQGFVPPQVSELYRGVKVPTLDPAVFTNYEVGGWFALLNNKASIDVAVYQLNGKDEIINVQQPSGDYANENAGETVHRGVEYGFNYKPISDLYIRLSGTNAQHEFKDYVESGVDFSNNEMATAPSWIANGEITYRPSFVRGLRVGIEWQHMDEYYTDAANTSTYEGFDIFHVRIGYEFKGFETWLNIMNVGDKIYATNVTKSAWGTNYQPGDPRTFNVGLAYKFQK
ncbi:TonB-dependent receptor [Reichenbachiella carrageenanivorans]|uniref:TonB-dependent receptor n=1 Tax=Reichenbachiella carrageenanivorans TaxID=2979869 RepID=A0ABY6D0M9_9BACT|nr:TonB-dependent receptor [Reichenbachiella carrageenanivorans]UXX79658.1 TonB-dependent receptor [Reichenbachiella carrageenanivorans]